MKKLFTRSKILIFILSISFPLFGQYTGTNPNVALSKLVEATDSVAGFEPGLAVDGDDMTYCIIPGPADAWVQISLGSYYKIDGYGILLPDMGQLPKSYIFQVSEDGTSWNSIASETITSAGEFEFDIPETDGENFVRILMTDKDANASFSEIRVYGEELQPPVSPVALPATEIADVSFRAHWTRLGDADGYVLSVSKNISFTDLVPGYGNLWVNIKTNWLIENLDPGTTYYYRARAYNKAGTSNFGKAEWATTLKGDQDISFGALDPMTYGDAAFELSATASSNLMVSYSSSDELVASIAGSTVTILGPGSASITATQAGNDQYNPATPVSQDLVVNKKDLTVTGAMAENKAYDGNTDALISGATLEGILGSDDVMLDNATSGIFAQADAGTGIAVSTSMSISGADVDKYTFTAVTDFTADITPLDLTVSAEDKSREECSSNPAFTLIYDGFVGDDDEQVLDEVPSATCDADESSPDGSYPIMVSGGADVNYNLLSVEGTLTVTPDAIPPVLVVKNASVQLDENDMASITPADVVSSASDNCSLGDTLLSQSTFTSADIGTVNVDVVLSDLKGNLTTETTLVVVEGNTVGMADRDKLEARFYPNPTSGMIHVATNSMADELVVMDITGKEVLRQIAPDKDLSVDLSPNQSGIYIFQLRFGEEVKQFKVIKK